MKRIVLLVVVALVMAAMVAPSAQAAPPPFCYTTTLGGSVCFGGPQPTGHPQQACREAQASDPLAASKCRAEPFGPI
jgi:hypothetical protein